MAPSEGKASRFFANFEGEEGFDTSEHVAYNEAIIDGGTQQWENMDQNPSTPVETVIPQPKDTIGSACGTQRPKHNDLSLPTTLSGNKLMGQSLKDIVSTTKMVTSKTTDLKTCSSLMPLCTSDCMEDASYEMASGGSPVPSASNSNLSQKSIGTSTKGATQDMGAASSATSAESLKTNKNESDGCGNPPTRFFYCAKASRVERDKGLLEGQRSGHPTIKPLKLCIYLSKLIKPPDEYLDDAKLLVPFAGSGSEMIGAFLAGWRNITGIELEQEYVDIARARIKWWQDAMESTQLTEPKEILKAMKNRKPAPLLERIDD